ncbi:MAG TPA: hypothetical protein ENH06_01030 [bacterium]|nr:hypothetical protein [bacterium]
MKNQKVIAKMLYAVGHEERLSMLIFLENKGGKAIFTELQVKFKLSQSQVKRYTKKMIAAGLIDHESRKPYKITELGKLFLKTIEELNKNITQLSTEI